MKPESLHQKTPLIIGSREDVKRVEALCASSAKSAG
ncbi:MAG TPA: hypothetical protein VFG95_10210 [Nitrospiria bacterium]|nr:hypothetical protein [Nitrospiria bacterium]